MKNKKLEKIVIIVTACFVVVTILLMFGGNLFDGSSATATYDMTLMPEATGMTEVISAGTVVEQSFVCNTETIEKIGIVFDRESVPTDAYLVIELLRNGKTVASDTYPVSSIKDQHRTYLVLDSRVSDSQNKKYTLRIYPVGNYDSGTRILVSDSRDTTYSFGNKKMRGTLCFSITE